MTAVKTTAIVLAAGMGTRMRSNLPKVMHPLAGRPVVDHVLAGLAEVGVAGTVVVAGPELEAQADRFAPHAVAIQRERLGTGHAVQTAFSAAEMSGALVLVVYGDTPLLRPATLNKLLAAFDEPGTDIALLAFRTADPGSYGRVVVQDGAVVRIVEAADATPEEAAIDLCNSGVIAARTGKLKTWLAGLTADNAKGEYYLTDVVAMAVAGGSRCALVEGGPDEFAGINTRADLAAAEAIFQSRYRAQIMAGGATLRDPATVYFSFDTKVGTDVDIGPHTLFGPGVTIENNVVIRGFCHIEGAHVGAGAVVGPFARLRPGADLAEDTHIGNFVEIKNAAVETGAKVNHLTYIGDARVGVGTNVGAGTITANYDGFGKHRTDIGAGVSVGSNTVFVAPVQIGDGAIIGAGSVVRKDVPKDAIAMSKAPQENRDGLAPGYRAAKLAAAKKNKKDG